MCPLSLRRPYDLFVLYVRMPLLSGTDFAEGLKNESPNVKIILISASADEALQKAAHCLGATLLSKPFTPDRLLQITAEMLGPISVTGNNVTSRTLFRPNLRPLA